MKEWVGDGILLIISMNTSLCSASYVSRKPGTAHICCCMPCCGAILLGCCHTVIDQYLLPTSNPTTLCCNERMQLTDKWTDTVPLRWPCCVYCMGSGEKTNLGNTRPFSSPSSGTTRVSRYQKGKTNLKQETVSGSGMTWAICKSAPPSRQITHQYPTTQFLQAGCPSCRPTNSVKALKANSGKCINNNFWVKVCTNASTVKLYSRNGKQWVETFDSLLSGYFGNTGL